METAVETTPVDAALALFDAGLDVLLGALEGGGLDHFDDLQFEAFSQRFERLRNRQALVDHHIVAEVLRRDLPGVWTLGSAATVLTSRLRISKAEANRRVRAAEAVGPRRSMQGQPVDPVRPVLAAAQRDGDVTPEHVAIVEHALRSVDRRGFDLADIDAGEQILTDHARIFGPEDLRLLAIRVVDGINPDGTLPDEEVNHDRRDFQFVRTRDGGAWTCTGRLTAATGAKLKTILDDLAKPRLAPRVPGATPNATESMADSRTHGQRMHDALDDVCDRMLREGTSSGVNAGSAHLVVIIDLDDLLNRTGHGVTTDGTVLGTKEILDLAQEATIVPACFNATGKLVDLGRTRRLASHDQTLALIARDRGCSFPHCTRAAQWCERHHILDWILDGLTESTTSRCSVGTTITNSPAEAGPAALTTTPDFPSGSHPAGSTEPRPRSSTTAYKHASTNADGSRRRGSRREGFSRQNGRASAAVLAPAAAAWLRPAGDRSRCRTRG